MKATPRDASFTERARHNGSVQTRQGSRSEAMETLSRKTFTREEILARVARFKDLKGSDGGLPDSHMPGCERTLFNVIGFQPPPGSGGGVTSPVGDQAAQLAAIK